MSVIKKILVAVATVALLYFAPELIAIIGPLTGTAGFLAAVIGSVVIAAGMTLLQMIGRMGSNTAMEAAKINVRIPEPPRWICAGRTKQGGGVLFGEFDTSGNFWYIAVHSDTILTSTVGYQLDDIPVTLDGNGYVTTSEFLPDIKSSPWLGGSGSGKFVRIMTTTHSEANPTPPAIAALKAAFPQWTDDHKLVGTTYSVVVMKSIKIEDRHKLYKWRGAFGIGEPAITLIGIWSNMYDPRDPSQTLGVRTTYKPSRNPALIWAWFRTHRYGRNKPESSINWERVAEQADICDQTVTGISGTHVRYQCDVAIPENKERIVAEQEILLTCDGQLVFDETGKTWMRVGYFVSPTLHLSRNRDIVAMESVEAQNGESETQGVVVRFIDPDANYTTQPSAPWYNPIYYVEGRSNLFMMVDIPGIQNHNQAMRVAKAIGERSQPAHKIAPTTGLRGLVAMRERFVNLQYDNTFAGDYEIATPVEVDDIGMFCSFGMVPLNPNRWTLLPGEEKAKGTSGGVGVVQTFDPPTNVVVTSEAGIIKATFDDPTRDDVTYRFQYIKTSDLASDIWLEMGVQMDDNLASSRAPLEPGVSYTVRYRTVSSGGTSSVWTVHGAVTADAPADAVIDYDGGDAGTEV